MASRMASRTLFKRFNIGERYASQVATVSATSSAAKAQVKTKNFNIGFGFPTDPILFNFSPPNYLVELVFIVLIMALPYHLWQF